MGGTDNPAQTWRISASYSGGYTLAIIDSGVFRRELGPLSWNMIRLLPGWE